MRDTTTTWRQIGRDQWSDHPHFPRQTLLLGSHESFRRVSDRVRELAREPAAAGAAMQLFHRWMAAMRGHEGYEEGKLYPYLERRYREPMAPLSAGHDALHAQQRVVMQAFYDLELDGDVAEPTGQAALDEALTDYDAILREHLELEEDWVIPMLLCLEPREFDSYCGGSIATLLANLEG